MLTHNDASILIWNAQSIRKKINEFSNFLNTQRIDICLLTETWLKQSESCSVQNYVLYRKDRSPTNQSQRNVGGGVAIAIRNGIQHRQIPDLDLEIIETIGIELQGTNIYAAYFPGSKLNAQKLRAFQADIIKISSIRGKFLVGGDLNSKHRFWNCTRGNKAGKVLFEEMSKRNFTIHFPDTPTYFPPQNNKTTPSTIDMFLTNGRSLISNVYTVNDLSSDHLPVSFKLTFSSSFISPSIDKRCYAKADWSLFRDYINNNIDLLSASRIDSTSKIDDTVVQFTTLIKRAEDVAVPYFKHKDNQLTVDSATENLISLRNYKRRHWQRYGSVTLRKEVNYLNRQIKSHMDSIKNEKWNTMLSKLKMNSNQLWKVTKSLKNQVKKIPPIKTVSRVLTTDTDKANEIGSEFCKAHSTTFNDLSDPGTEGAVAMSNNSINFFSPTIKEVMLPKPREISRLIRGLKNRKSPGEDSINNGLLKQLPKKAIVMLMYVYRACFRLSYFPNAWKRAKIVPIPKPGKNHTLASSYRPISLLNALSKILEKLVLKRLILHISSRNLFKNEQFGFRPGHSTNHQLLRVCKYIQTSLKKKHSTGMITFDIEKAFDSVWHKGLLHKMFILKFPLYLVKIVQSYLSKRSFYVSINDHSSKIFHILAGVPQGSALSPTLYNIFTCDLNITSSEKALFADDTCLYQSAKSPSKIIKKLNAASKQITDFSTKWKIKLNDAKTHATFFTRKTAQRWLPSQGVLIRNQEIAWNASIKYLGVNLDKTLTFKSHTDIIQEKALKFLGALYPLLNKKSRLNIHNKIQVYRAIIQSVLLGACPVWGNCAKVHIQKLQIIQNKCLKIILNLPSYHNTIDLHKRASIPMIPNQIEKINLSFKMKTLSSKNPLIRNLF